MAYTKEQNEQFKKYLSDNKLEANTVNAQAFIKSQNPTQADLEAKIKTGNFTGADTARYNQMTGNNQGAREVALQSPEALKSDTLKTSVSAPEVAKIQELGVKPEDISKNITVDKGVKEELAPNIEKTTVKTPEGITETTKETPKVGLPVSIEEWKKSGSDKNVLEQMIEDKYKTVATQNEDGSITAQIGDKNYKWSVDNAGNPIKTEVLPSEIKQDPNLLYQQIQSGAFIDKNTQNTIEYKKAYQRKTNIDKFSNLSPSNLANSINTGEFLPGTQVYDDLKMVNPQLVEDAVRLNNVNSINQPITTYQDMQLKISEYLGKMLNNDEKTEFSNKLSENKEIVELNKNLAESSTKLTEYKDQLEYAKEDLEKELEGKTVSKGYMNSKLGERTRNITRLYNSELSNYNTTAGQIQTISENIKYEIQEERQNLQTAVGLYQTITADERELEMNKKQMDLQAQYSYGDLNSQDPLLQNIAIERAINDLYKTYPIVGMQSPTTKIQAVKDLISQGKTPQEALQMLENDIRNSPGYKSMVTPETQTTQDWQKLNDGSLYNQRTGETKIITGNSVTPQGINQVTPTGNYTNLTYTNKTGTKKTIKVDTQAKDSLKTALNSLGNSIVVGDSFRDSARQEALYKELSAKGAQVAKPGTSKHEQGLAIDLYSDNKYNPLTAEQTKIMNDNGWYQTAGEDDLGHFEYLGTQGGYSEIAEAWANNIIGGKAKLSQITGQENADLKNQVVQIMNEKSGGSTGKTQDNLVLGIDVVNSLINHPGRSAATGVNNIFTNPFGYALPTSNARDFQATLKQFNDLQFLNAVPQMQGMGALSNLEGSRLSGALTKLQDTGISEEDFLEELQRVKEVMNIAYKNMTGNEYGIEQEQSNGTGTTTNYTDTKSIKTNYLNY